MEQLASEPERAAGGDLLHEEVPGVLERWEPRRVRTGRGSVVRGGGVLVEPLVRPHGVVLAAEGIEGPLLRGTGATDGADRLALERAVHALVRPWGAKMRAVSAGRGRTATDVGGHAVAGSTGRDGRCGLTADSDGIRRTTLATGPC